MLLREQLRGRCGGNKTHLFSMTLTTFVWSFNCCCACSVFMTGVCKCSQGWVLLANMLAGYGGEWQMWLSRIKGFICILWPEQHVSTRRQRAARQHSSYFQGLELAHQCKKVPLPNTFSWKDPEPKQNVIIIIHCVIIHSAQLLWVCSHQHFERQLKIMEPTYAHSVSLWLWNPFLNSETSVVLKTDF